MLTSIISAVVILGLLIIVHEAGHFFVAKRLGVRVLRFSIGYPPRIAGIRRGETEYVIGATPVGGYVRMLGEEIGEEPKSEELSNFLVEIGYDLTQAALESPAPRSDGPKATGSVAIAAGRDVRGPVVEDLANATLDGPANGHSSQDEWLEKLATQPEGAGPAFSRTLKPEEILLLNRIRLTNSAQKARASLTDHPPEELLAAFRARAFPSQRLWKRFAIVLAGPVSNVLLAPILLALLFMYGVPTTLAVIGEVKAGMPAMQAGLQPGDKIISVNNKPTPTWADFSEAVRGSNGNRLTLEVDRPEGATSIRITIKVTPRREEQKTIYNSTVTDWVIGVTQRGDSVVHRMNPLSATYHAIISTASLTAQLVVGIAKIITGGIPVREALGGPIAIARMAGQQARQGFANVVMFTVMLSIQLGLINLLPVPLLDGGHLAFFAYEGLRGKPLEMRHREIALQVGLFLLVALMAFAIFNDISRIVQG